MKLQKTLLRDRLSPAGRAQLDEIARSALTVLGRRHSLQHIVDRSRAQIDYLLSGGASLDELSWLLAEVGMLSGSGERLARGTLSKALSRNAVRPEANSAEARPTAAARGELRLVAADDSRARHTAAGDLDASSSGQPAQLFDSESSNEAAAPLARGTGAPAVTSSDALGRAAILIRLKKEQGSAE
jgi:hypothetical protein